jgi:hypothetical protein
MKTRGAVLYQVQQPAPLDPEDERLNPIGGTIALGHPLGGFGGEDPYHPSARDAQAGAPPCGTVLRRCAWASARA